MFMRPGFTSRAALAFAAAAVVGLGSASTAAAAAMPGTAQLAGSAASVVQKAPTVKKSTHKKKTTHKKKATHRKKTTVKKVAVIKISGPPTVSAAGKFHETITISLVSGKTPLSGRAVELVARPNAATPWTAFQHGMTATKTGTVTMTIAQTGASEQYQALFPGSSGFAAASSGILSVKRA
jgi:hypothetical protein